MTPVSVLVISHERDTHLRRQQDALARTPGWDEAVVAFLNQPDEPWDKAPARVRTLHHASPGLALAAGRNAAARAARGDVLVFLDVDCLPEADTVASLARECAPGRVVMADPHYLPPGWAPPLDPGPLALPHPSRASLGFGRSEAWPMFWSLGFAVRADDFARVGGFDEAYAGYGGEDTDLAFRCREAGLELWLSRARVLHQAHAVHRPPLHHLTSIVTNAHRFRERWDVWPMEGWLSAFADRGFIAVGEERIEVLRTPTDAEVAATRVEDARF
ncbi:glycosyltransferase family 2 protein [Mariniluteicoccus flavus]